MNPRIARRLVLGAALAAALIPARARAQRGVDAELFHPALDSYGIFEVDRADVSPQWGFGLKLFTNFASSPLRATMSDPSDPSHAKTISNVLIDKQVATDLGFHLGLTHWLELVMDFPVSAQSYTDAYGHYGSAADPMLARTGFYASDPYTNIAPPNATPLDARVGFKAKLFRSGTFGMGAAAIVTLPFGDDSAFLGDAGFTFQPKLIADVTRGPLTAAVNVGAIIRQDTRIFDPYDPARLLFDVGDELTWSVGVAYRFVHWVGVGAEAVGQIPVVGMHKDFTADVLVGIQLFPTRSVAIAAGAGADVLPSGDRQDQYRVFLGVSWAPVRAKGDTPIAGVDSDGDGIPDAQDLCPNEPEDKDGFDDEDGCPDTDNDQDGIPDAQDKCPDQPEDKDGFEDADGCPELDNDRDGVADAQDKCPNDPEDRDGFQDDDGCPDDDNDGDGIPDAKDKCPNEPETFNGVDDADGCPDTGGAVIVTPTQLELPEQLVFATDEATLAPRSEALLGRVADRIKAHPNVKRIRIEGHTDDVGTPAKNQQLSQQRAEAVRDFLIGRGVEPDRLQAVGFGNSRPIDPRRTAKARARNRRVEFIIVEP